VKFMGNATVRRDYDCTDSLEFYIRMAIFTITYLPNRAERREELYIQLWISIITLQTINHQTCKNPTSINSSPPSSPSH
jgi:hypothetical protein